MGIKKRWFLVLSGILYILFVLETLTGYWIWKPRVIGEIFKYALSRGDAYYLHVKLLPVPLIFFFFVHVLFALRKYFKKNEIIYFSVVVLNLILFAFFLYLHFI